MGAALSPLHHQAALFVHIQGGAFAAVKGHMSPQVYTARLVRIPDGGKALPLKTVQRAVKTKVRHALRQGGGVRRRIHGNALQRQAGAVGQLHCVKIALRLGQIDANATHNGMVVRHPLAQNTYDLFTVQQQVVGPFDLALDAVPLFQRIRHGHAGK